MHLVISEKSISKEFHCRTIFEYVNIQLFISVNFALNKIILKIVFIEN